MSVTVPPDYWTNVLHILEIFFPQYFDPANPDYVDPGLLDKLLLISNEFRPYCLSEDRQNFAQAMYLAYLISVQQETASGQELEVKAGPITSEKEGDIMVTYSMSPGGSTQISKRPVSDPWDAWNRLWQICARGAITTRFGQPI